MSAHAALHERFDALAAQGAAARAPLDWHFATVLAQRAENASGAVQARLAERLNEALTRLERAVAAPKASPVASGASPLAALLDEMGAPPIAPMPSPAAAGLSPRGTSATPRNVPSPRPELKSVGRMRKTLSRLKVRQQVSQALAQPPEHAGPINSQMLVLRSLALMQDISPEYLHRFMSHVDALMTLEDAQRLPLPGQAAAKAAKATSKGAGKSSKR